MSKLLLVEDDPDNARMIARRLRSRGFEVEMATDGATAIEMTQEHLPDAIIMDLNLIGGMNGLEATRRIKKIPETQAIPVIIVSAVQLSSFQEEAMEAGVADFDDKPIEFDRLVGKIQALLNPS